MFCTEQGCCWCVQFSRVPDHVDLVLSRVWCLCAARDTKAHDITCTHCTATMKNFVVVALLLNGLDC